MDKPTKANIIELFDGLVFRQRLLVMICLLSVVYAAWYFIVGAAAEKSLEMARQENNYLAEKAEALQPNHLSEASIKSSLDTVKLNNKLKLLRQEVEQINADLANYLSIIVSADELMLVVKNILESQPGLVIEEIKLLPEETVVLGNYLGQEYNQGDGQAQEYDEEESERLEELFLRKHKISIVFRGGYQDVADYLQALESLEWNLYMQDITYRVEDYPEARVELVVYALTIEKEQADA
jgi:MSHA biogenesis protein MshJ